VAGGGEADEALRGTLLSRIVRGKVSSKLKLCGLRLAARRQAGKERKKE
jgi:hypothetical protein